MTAFRCPRCGGSAYQRETRRKEIPKAGSAVLRNRVCESCGALTHTIEIPREVFDYLASTEHLLERRRVMIDDALAAIDSRLRQIAATDALIVGQMSEMTNGTSR